jgi:aldose 1-epimerase
MSSSTSSRIFGHLPSGQAVEAYTLKGAGGLELEAITYGGIVTRLVAPDRHGRPGDVVLGFRDLASYLAGHPYFGAITGRTAGRITHAQYTLEGRLHRLVPNDPPNHLHGNFDKRLWTPAPVVREDQAPSLRLTYRSPDGEDGHPGNIEVAVTYTIMADNTFLIESEASADRATPFNLTHHGYFNLAGEGSGSIEDHELEIQADSIVACDDRMTPLGKCIPVSGAAADLRRPRRLGEVIPHLFQNHGDLYVLPRPAGEKNTGRSALVPAARLTDPASGRVLDVWTTEAFFQLYTGASLDGSLTGKSGVTYGRFSGVCLECENYPDGANTPALGNIILRPGEVLRHTTAYSFSTV